MLSKKKYLSLTCNKLKIVMKQINTRKPYFIPEDNLFNIRHFF